MWRHEKTAYASYDDLDRAIDAGELTEPAVWELLGYTEVAGVMKLPVERATRYTPTVIKPPAGAGLVGLGAPEVVQDMAFADMNIWELLDMILPEELVGLDITPDQVGGTDPGFFGLGARKTGRTLYDNVWIENGKVKVIRKGETRTLGYTPRFAKKKFRTKRRRKRLTKRDMYILEVMKQNPQAGALALML